jgi:peptidoglycan/LPS O-acetylase OafA/YrhL
LRAFYFVRNYNTGTGYTWLVADGLAIGAFLAAVARGPWGTRSRMWTVTAVLLTLSLITFVAGYPFGIFLASRLLGMTLRGTALNLFFAGSIASALLIGTSRWKAIVNRPVLQFFGDISYGVYLIHMIVFDLEDYFVGRWFPSLSSPNGHFSEMVLLFAIATCVIVAVASFSRWYFEEPFLRMKERFEGRHTRSDSAPKATARSLG